MQKFLRKLSLKFFNLSKFILTFPMSFGNPNSSDYYPALERNVDFITTKRIDFWNKIAKKHLPFKPFYEKDAIIDYLQSINLNQDHKYYKQIKNLYENGYCLINNFANTFEHHQINSLFNEKLSNKLSDTSDIHIYKIKENKINDMLHKKISLVEEIIFGKKMKQKYTLSQIAIINGKSPYKASINMHQDKFIPSFKLFYFPTEVTTNPFEYYSGSHFIDKQFMQNAHISSKTRAGDNRDYKFNFSGYKKIKFYVKANTLVIAATNGFHRRFHENKDGVRKFITVGYYNKFTWIDLLKNYFIKN